MPPLTPEERRRRVDKVVAAAERLRLVEAALLDAMARLPALQREVAAIREEIQQALDTSGEQ